MKQLKGNFSPKKEDKADLDHASDECRPKASRHLRALMCLLLVLMILAVYWQVQHHAFIHYDDQAYVTDNHHVRSGITKASLIWAFTTDEAGFWHPLTWLSLLVDYELYGLNAGGIIGRTSCCTRAVRCFCFGLFWR